MILKEGDIFFIYLTEEENVEFKEIKELFIGYENNHFNHVGLYIGNDEIVEAAHRGVRKTDIGGFLENTEGKILVGRIDNEIVARRSAVVALDYLGLPYNHSYTERDDAFYCSQLIHHVYEKANKGPFFKKHQLNFKDLKTGKLRGYWLDYYARLGLTVPEGEEGSHPSNLSLDGKITKRFYLDKEFRYSK